MKKILTICFLLTCWFKGFSQSSTDQNGLRTTVTNSMSTVNDQAMRYDIARIGYNSFHWQSGGLVIIELFNRSYKTGYEKYILENGYGQGANSGTPALKLVESAGIGHDAKISIGPTSDLTTSLGGYVNKSLPVYLDVKDYSTYIVKLTYLQDKVEQVVDLNQIKVNVAPAGTPIPSFSAPSILDNNLSSSKNLMVTGDGNHYISNGNLAIGTTDPRGYKLAVAGNMIAESVKVQLKSAWPDYVFKDDYKFTSLQETEKHIKEKGHLPGIPSAAEVKLEGIDLGEMNGRLLKKIEEMTLQMIDMNKLIQTQQELLKQQQNSIETIQSKLK